MNNVDIQLPIRSANNKPKIGFVFSGGGAKTAVFIGLYQALIDNNIPIDVVTGTSAGGQIGALIALGHSPKKMENIYIEIGSKGFCELKDFNFFYESIFDGKTFDHTTSKYLGSKEFSDTKIPFGCVAVNLESGKKIELTKGLLSKAVRASGSLPIVFPPVFLNNRYLIDGGVLDNTPAMLARKLGADKLIVLKLRSDNLRQKIAGKIFKNHILIKKQNKFLQYLNQDNLTASFTKRIQNDLQLFMEISNEEIALASHYTTDAIVKQANPDLVFTMNANAMIVDYSKKTIKDLVTKGKEFGDKNIQLIKNIINQK